MIENNVQFRNSNINFAGGAQAKKTFSKMQKYYQGMKDYANEDLYKSMDNKAKAHLHIEKSVKFQNAILDFSEMHSEEVLNGRDKLNAFAKMTKLSVNAIYENLLGMFYSLRK